MDDRPRFFASSRVAILPLSEQFATTQQIYGHHAAIHFDLPTFYRSCFPLSMQAYVSDQCPECAESDLDFAQAGDGRWEIEWHFVECAGGGPPEFVFEGSNPFFWKLQPRGTASPVERLAVNGMDLIRTNDNFFEIVVGLPFEGEQTVEVWTITGGYYSLGVSL